VSAPKSSASSCHSSAQRHGREARDVAAGSETIQIQRAVDQLEQLVVAFRSA
jgi:hypothetical protein